jgi:hypothetical protein
LLELGKLLWTDDRHLVDVGWCSGGGALWRQYFCLEIFEEVLKMLGESKVTFNKIPC